MITRRNLVFLLAVVSPLLGLGRARAAQDNGEPCEGLDSLSRSQRSMRRALGFKIQTEDERRCLDCAFYSADPAVPGCGGCSLLGGEPVHAASVCDSWATE